MYPVRGRVDKQNSVWFTKLFFIVDIRVLLVGSEVDVANRLLCWSRAGRGR